LVVSMTVAMRGTDGLLNAGEGYATRDREIAV
jgi:hypothetical protein